MGCFGHSMGLLGGCNGLREADSNDFSRLNVCEVTSPCATHNTTRQLSVFPQSIHDENMADLIQSGMNTELLLYMKGKHIGSILYRAKDGWIYESRARVDDELLP